MFLLGFLSNFSDYTIIKDITTYSTSFTGFISLTNYGIFCSLNNNSFLIDNGNNGIFTYNSNWNFINKITITSPYALFAAYSNSTNDTVIYVTSINGIYKFTSNWTQLTFVNSNYSYRNLIFNETVDHLLVTTNSAPKIQVFDKNLIFIKSISIPYFASGIKEYNNQFFVTTYSSFVFLLQNEVIIYNFSTLCGSINALAIDSNGLLALLCLNKIYVYNSNGKYMNISWISLVPSPQDLGFDAGGNFVITATNGVNLLNKQIQTIKQNFTIDNACIFQSI